jgi:hypothetical protein
VVRQATTLLEEPSSIRIYSGYPGLPNSFTEGYIIAQLRSSTGLSLAAFEYYVGIVDTQKMGDSLAKVEAKNP